jgi:hypothetical protein
MPEEITWDQLPEELLVVKNVKKFMDSKMAGFFFYPSSKARTSDSIYVLVGYECEDIHLPICVKIRIGGHPPTHDNDGQYYFVSLRKDCSREYNEGQLTNAINHVKRIIGTKKAEDRRKLNQRF